MISVVIPIYNEASLIDILAERTKNVLVEIGEPFEIIYVNDGSKDESLSLLIQHHNADKRIKILSLSRNFGHQAAYTAGMKYAKGDFVILMDGDLQDPPEVIKQMFSTAVKQGLDVVFAKREDRQEGFVKKGLFKIFHFIYNKTSDIHAPENVGNFCCMNRKALNSLLDMKERNRYLPGLRFFIGFKQGAVLYSRHERESGKAKMNYSHLIQLALNAIFSFSNFPLKFCLYIGILGIIVSAGAGTFSLVCKILELDTPGWSSILLSIYFLGSIQLIFLGVLGEYIFRIYTEIQNRPLYFIDKFYE